VLENLTRVLSLFFLFSVSTVNAGYVYEADQSLFNLVNEQNTTNMAVGDDQVSSAFTLDFTFTFYGEDFTTARMATNGCLHFGSSGGYCNDYTPDPLPEITYTLYPFWTDLIRDNGSSVLAKNFTDKTVFGWYNLREYNRSNTDNSFEVVLWKADDSFEYRYGALNIINHDVLIGEQGAADELYTYLFHDECSTGTTNVSGSCVNTNWNSIASNTLLESGGSLYGLGSGNALDCSNPLNNTACVGYAAAFLTQQCDLDGLYSTQCPNYWDDLFDYECSLDSQYSPACPGYMVEVYTYDTYYEEDIYGYDDYQDEYYGYEDEYYEEMHSFEEVDFYADDLSGVVPFEEEFYFEETLFFEDEYFDSIDIFLEETEYALDEEFITLPYIEEETYIQHIYDEVLLAEDYFEIDHDLPILDDVLLDRFEHEELIEEYLEEETIEFLDFETIEEMEEFFEEEFADEQTEEEMVEELVEELADEEVDEDSDLENSESLAEEREGSDEDIEITVVENTDKKNSKRARQLNVVAKSIKAATNSVSGTTSGTSAEATGMSASSSVQTNVVTSSVSGGTVSVSNSPSISDQVASSAAQTQQILSMSAGADISGGESGSSMSATDNTTMASSSSSSSIGSSSSFSVTPTVSVDSSPQVVMAEVQVQNMQGEIDTAISGVMTASEADEIADQIIAQNIQNQQEELEDEQSQTGEYGDSSTLIAYMGYVPGFNTYSQAQLPQASDWYEPEAIYANVAIPDNNSAFMGMYSDSLNGMNSLINMQPKL